MSEEDEKKISNIFGLIEDGTLRFTDEGEVAKSELDKSMSRHPAGKKRRPRCDYQDLDQCTKVKGHDGPHSNEISSEENN